MFFFLGGSRLCRGAQLFWRLTACAALYQLDMAITLVTRSGVQLIVTFQNFTDVRFGPFSNLAGVSFREI